MTTTLYRGVIRDIQAAGVVFEIPSEHPGYRFGPAEFIASHLSIGDSILVGNVGSVQENFVIFGKLTVVDLGNSLTSEVTVQRTSPSDLAYVARDDGDTVSRFAIYADGKHEWGSGSVTRDTNLYRSAVDTLTTDGSFEVGDALAVVGASTFDTLSTTGVASTGALDVNRSSATDNLVTSTVGAESQKRLIVTADGKVLWGSGSAVGDTNLYRSAANSLQTDDSLVVGTNLNVTGDLTVNGLNFFERTGAQAAVRIREIGDPQPRLELSTTGQLLWGDGSVSGDTNLFRSAADTLKTNDSFIVGANLTVTGSVTLGASSVTTSNTVSGSGTTTSTSYTATLTGSTSPGMTFVAPPSGVVTVLWACQMVNGTSGETCRVSYELRTGATIGSGTQIVAPSDGKAIMHRAASATNDLQAGNVDVVTGLTPGSTYNIQLFFKVTAGTGTFSQKRVYVLPAVV